MTNKALDQLKSLTPQERKEKIMNHKKNMMNFRFARKANMEVKTHHVRQWRRDIARLKTLETLENINKKKEK